MSEAGTPSPRQADFFYEHLRLAAANQQSSERATDTLANDNLTFYRDSSTSSTPEPEAQRFVNSVPAGLAPS